MVRYRKAASAAVSQSARDLSDVLSRYQTLDLETIPSSKIDADFKRVIRGTPSEALAHSLVLTIKSPATPSLGECFVTLYRKSKKRRRTELLGIVFETVPAVLTSSLRDQFASFPASAQGEIKISDDDVLGIVSEAESIDPQIVEVVAGRWASQPSELLKLDSSVRGVMLNTLATNQALFSELAGDPSIADPDSGHTWGVNKYQSVREVSPETTEEHATTTPEATPPPRYACVQAFQDDGTGVRGVELGAAQPMKKGDWYQFEVSVRLTPKGLTPTEARRPLREPRQDHPVDIIVVAQSDDFGIHQPVMKLVLPPKGDSTQQAILRVSPNRSSNSATDLLELKLKLYYQLNLLEILIVRGEALRSTDEDTVSKFGLSPAVDLAYGRLRQSDANDFDLMTPVSLNIHVEPHQQQYMLTFTFKRKADELAFSAPVSLTSAQLEDVIAGARKSLFQVCSSDTLGTQIKGDDVEYGDHITKLSETGSNLWSILFNRDNSTSISVVGDWLKDNPLPEGSKIQISLEEGASTFVFAWGLLYDGKCPAGPIGAHMGFWGMRYIIEQRPVRLSLPAQTTLEKPELEIAAMYWQFDQTPDQQKYLQQLVQQAKTATLTGGQPINSAQTALQCITSGSSQILYFYTHGFTRLPDGERYGVTVEDFVRLYDTLPDESSTRHAWKGIADQIKQKQFQSDKSYIELSYGRLDLEDLYRDVKALPNRPIVILNMCDSAQVTPSLAESFIDFFLSRGARAVIGTECSIRPVFADFVGRELLSAALRAQPIGATLRNIRLEAARNKNLLGLAYTLFGAADSALLPAVLQ